MRRIFSFVFLILFAGIISAQDQKKIKSIELALNELTLNENNVDTIKVRLLNELAEEYQMIDTSHAIHLINESIALSSKSSYALGLGMSYESLGELKYYHGHYLQAILQFQKARSQYLLAGDKARWAGATVDEGNANLLLSNYDIALKKYEEAQKIFEELNNTAGMSRCLNNMGIIYKNFGEYAKALNTYQTVVNLYLKANDEKSLIDVYINIGVVLVKTGDYNHALENFNKALVYAEKFDDKKKQAIALMNSGVIHNKMNDYTKALEYYEKALDISIEIGDKVETSKCLTNIGTNYISLEKYDLAEDFVKRGLLIKKELGDLKSIANCYNFLAEIHYHQQDFANSILMDKQAISLKRKVNDPDGLARCYSNISRTYLALNQLEYALLFADSSLFYSTSIGALEHCISAYFVKKEVMVKLGDFKKAYELGELYKVYSDSLMNENKVRAVNEIEFKYQAKVLEEENEQLRLRAEIDSLLIIRHRKILILVLVALFLIAVSIILLIIIQTKQKQYNHTLEKKNQIITKQNIKLDNFNRTKDKILSVITHDIRGTIGNQLTALSVLAKEEFRNEEERKLVFSRLANSATLSLELLENLTLWTKIQEGLVNYHPEEAYLDKTFEEVMELFHESIENKELHLINEIKDEYPCFYDQFMIKSILKNLFSNAIKFSNRGGEIRYGVSVADKYFRVYIADKGIGVSQGEINQLKQGKISKMRRGTENEKGSGLGLSLVKTFLDHHNSELQIESASSGTQVSFLIPLKRPN